MPKYLSVTGFCTFPINEGINPDKKYAVESAPMPRILPDPRAPEGLKTPDVGLTLIFGMTSVFEDLAQCRKLLFERGIGAFPVSIELLPAQTRKSSYRVDDLPDTKILHLDRLTRDLMSLIVNHLERFAREEGHPFPWPERRMSYHNIDIIKYRPHLLARLHALPAFQHIELFGYPVASPQGLSFKRLTLFSRRPIHRLQAIDDNLPQVVLPDGLPDDPRDLHQGE